MHISTGTVLYANKKYNQKLVTQVISVSDPFSY